jgi:hypothetical protein
MFLVSQPNSSLGTDAMQKPITTFSSLKRLFDVLELDFIKSVIAVIWRVIAAVRCFLQTRSNARHHRQAGETTGAMRS